MKSDKRILLVSGYRDLLESTKSLMKTIGYFPVGVSNRSGALRIYRMWDPDIVMFDRGSGDFESLPEDIRVIEKQKQTRARIVSRTLTGSNNPIDGVDAYCNSLDIDAAFESIGYKGA